MIIYSKLLFVFILISNTCSVYYAAAFDMEELCGGYPAIHKDFKYQAVLLGKYNFTYSTFLLCSAAIVSDFFLLSAARCFLHNVNEQKKPRLFAAVGLDVLTTQQLNLKEIENVYVYYHAGYRVDYNLAMIRLRDSLRLEFNLHLSALQIPDVFENFYGRTGVVAGYGIDVPDDIRKQQNREQIRVPATDARFLRSASVTIINPENFIENDEIICDQFAKEFREICGIIEPDAFYDYRGVCMGDNGAPLVIDGKLLGIVTRHSNICHDTIHGTVYTRVSRFKNFIDLLKEGIILNGTAIYNNPLHISNPKYRIPLASRS